ncbi:MAG: NIL domain-containing protein [Chloroflexota bacterium]
MASRRIVLHFPQRIVNEPIIYRLVKDFDLKFNILKAQVSPEQTGLLVMELTGEPRNYDLGIKYLTENGVKVEALSRDVVRNDARCTHCGACINLCPTGAFYLEADTRRVLFDDSKCNACGFCIKACPPRAKEVYF